MTPTGNRFGGQSFHGVNETYFSWAVLLAATTLAFQLGVVPVQAAGSVVAWGDNDSSQSSVPVHPAPRNVTAVAGGVNHSLALESGGKVVGWGDNTQGEASAPPGALGVMAIAAGYESSLALQSNGVVVAWGGNNALPAGLTNAVALGVCSNNFIALTGAGGVVSWGVGAPPPDAATNLVAVAPGNSHSLALRGDGSVIAWGDNSAGQTAVPSGLTNVLQLAAGAASSLALQADGTVIAWGDNTWGQGTVPTGLTNVVAIAAGARHCVALQQNGAVVVWGDSSLSQLNMPYGLANVCGIAAGSFHTLAVVGDGSPVITVEPVSQYDASTGTASFGVLAAGSSPLSYQWQENGTNLAGATNSLLVLPNFTISTAAVFSVAITNLLGSVTSATVTLPPAWNTPVITLQPQGETVNCGGPALFQGAAAGTAPLAYQWQLEGTNLPDATNSTLSISEVTDDNAGDYILVVSNASGVADSQVAVLTVNGAPPLITSPLSASGKQGVAFSYAIAGLNYPSAFMAEGLPDGLSVNATNGVIEGTPLVGGSFIVELDAANLCSSATTNLVLDLASAIPAITSRLTASGFEQAGFTYAIKANNSPQSFWATNLPQGLSVDPADGVISGVPVYAGNYAVTISASNNWGVGSARLQLTVSNALVSGLSIANLRTNYSAPYLLNFQFSIRDNDDPAQGNAIVAAPGLFTVTAFEDGVAVDPSETPVILAGVNQGVAAKVLKAYLVLDFTESVAHAVGGALDSNGVPVAVDAEVSAAQAFVDQQSTNAQIGIYEFHSDNEAPRQVMTLTTDKTLLNNDLAGIWTNYVQGFPAGSRCWDALVAAIGSLGTNNAAEEHVVVFCSDGNDTSSGNTFEGVINDASNANVQVYCVGFGNDLDTNSLESITSDTAGRYYEATNLTTLASDFALISKDVNGQYFLRWATLNRTATAFMPSFQISYQDLVADSPTNPPPFITETNYVIDTNTVPATTNDVYTYATNYIISPYLASTFAGDVTVGLLQLESDADVRPSAITLLANYIPRYLRDLHLHYRANWPCTLTLQYTNVGDQLYGWSLTQTNDGAGGHWAWLTSSNQDLLASSIPAASFGPLLDFRFQDILNASNAFSVFAFDNTIYTNTGGQSLRVINTNAFLTGYPALPHGTPVPWLIQYGFTNSATWASDETNDVDGNGLMIWQDYVAGLNPTNRSSLFAVQTVSATSLPGELQITFRTSLNRTYRVETSSDLLNWQTLQDGIAGTGGAVTVTDDRGLPGTLAAYYRVAVY